VSYVSIYRFDETGKYAGEFARVSNGMAGALVIWRAMAFKYGLEPIGGHARAMETEEKVWKHCNAGKMSRVDTICVRFTYDRVWVKKENCVPLADALTEFHRGHVHGTGINPTVLGVANGLRHAACDNLLGVAFRQTSVIENPWCTYDDGGETEIPYDLNAPGGNHFELFDEALPNE
jgi:hypothetical protein